MKVTKWILVVLLSMTSELSLSSEIKTLKPTKPTASSLADHLHPHAHQDSIDHGWLADLTGLPTPDQVNQMTARVVEVLKTEQDSACRAINVHLKEMMFQHFLIYQHIANAQGVFLDENIAHQWAHMLAMVLKESSGDSTSVTDMSGRSISTYRSKTNFEHWKTILNIAKQHRVQFNDQTNFGLTQVSDNRLFVAFDLAQQQVEDVGYLEGKSGLATQAKTPLNTAIAIRRLIWFYQDFAQGRTSQDESRIHEKDINQPEYSARHQTGIKMALLYCGTPFMFRYKNVQEQQVQLQKIEQAMESIAYCKLGNAQEGYGHQSFDERCFADWVTLCPALNIDIALLTPLSYFATRDAQPVCEASFKSLLNPAPH